MTQPLEPEMTAYLKSKFAPRTVFLDVGANVGYYTLLAAPLVKSVIAFEPQPVFQKELERRVEGYANVRVCPFALFSRSARGAMSPTRHKGIFHPERSGGYQVVAVTLDSLRLSPSVVKIDVEGAEMDVLMGGKSTLLAHRPVLAIEVHLHRMEKYFGVSPERLYRFLDNLGYAVLPLGSRPDPSHICAEWSG